MQNSPEAAPLHCWEIPSHPWQHIHRVFARPFHQKMFLTIVDVHSEWPEAEKP